MRSGERPAEALWRDACGSARARPLRRRYGAFYTDALLRVCRSAIARRLRKRYVATPTEALARRLRKRYGASPEEAL